mgnify:FL=1
MKNKNTPFELTFVFALFVENFGIVLKFLAVSNDNTLLFLETFKSKSVFRSKLGKVWSIKDVK